MLNSRWTGALLVTLASLVLIPMGWSEDVASNCALVILALVVGGFWVGAR